MSDNRYIDDEMQAGSKGVWLPDEYIEQLLLTIMANAKALTALANIAALKDEMLAGEIIEVSMRITDMAISITEVTQQTGGSNE